MWSYPFKLKAYIFVMLLTVVANPMAFSSEKVTFSSPSFAPFYFPNESNFCQGVAVQVFDDIAAQLNLPYEFVSYPYARILHSLKNKQLDIALMFKNSDLLNYVDYIGPVSKSKVVVLTHNQQLITQYADLSKLNTIAVIRKANFEDKFDNDSSLNKVAVESYAQAIMMFNLGRVDAVVGSVIGLDYQLRAQQLDVAMLNNAYVLGEKEWWLHVRKNLTATLKEQLYSSVKSNYQTDLIYKAYLQYIAQCSETAKN